jgi:hypothetical protein
MAVTRVQVQVVLVLAVLALGAGVAGADRQVDGWDDTAEDLSNATDVEPGGAGNVSVGLTPSEATVPPGTQQAFDIVVTGVDGGIAAYEFNITVGSPDIASIVAYDPVNQPAFGGASIEENGSVLDAMVALGDNKHDPGETRVVATVTVEGANGSLGSTPLGFTGVGVMDNENAFYSVTEVGNGTLNVEEGAVTVEVRPAGEEWLTGSPLPVEVAVQFADDGVGAFEVELALEGNATVTDYTLTRAGTDSSQVAADGSTVTLDLVPDEPYAPGEEILLGEVMVLGEALGTLDIESTGAVVSGAGGTEYGTSLGGASLALVEGPPPVAGESRPTDLDGDLHTEDIDGDGVFTIFDVQSFFLNFQNTAVQNNPQPFDFDGSEDGQVTIFDVQSLFLGL